MSQVPVQIIVAAFKDPNGAENALNGLKEAQREGVIKIEDAAVLNKDAQGQLHIKETADMGGGKGAAVGGVIGGVIGILAGPAGVVVGAAAGAAIGGLAAKMVDAGFPDERLREIGAGLQPNTSAIVAVVDEVWVIEAERQMQEAGAKVVTAALSADIAKQLAEGKEVAYSAVKTDEAVGITRVAAGGDEAKVSDVVATKDGVYMDEITKKGENVTVAAAVVTKEGAVLVEGEGKVTPAEAIPAAASTDAATAEAKPAAAADQVASGAKPAEEGTPTSQDPQKPAAPAS